MMPTHTHTGRRLLFVANGLHGHLTPMLPLALAARAAGHAVAFATGPDPVEFLHQHGLHNWPVGLTHAHAGGNHQDSWLDYFVRTAQARLADLLPRAQQWRPDTVIHEETELSGPVVATLTGARRVVHGLGIMPPPRLWPFLAAAVDRLGSAHGAPSVAVALAAAPYLHLCPPSLQRHETPVWRHTLPLRPMPAPLLPGEQLPPAFDKLPYPRTLCLSLGTVYNHRATVLQQAVEGLLKLTANLVVTVGSDQNPALLGALPPHVLVARYVSNTLLLPRCCLVVSHGGSGTLLGTLGEGLPTLLLPQGADQFGNAEAAQASGAALVLGPDAVTVAAVTAAAQRLLDEPGFAAAARSVQAEIRALPDAAAVLAQL